MSNHKTFTLIKPDAMEANNAGPILHQITDAGFEIIALKLTQLTKSQAKQFYAVHKDKAFFEKLTDFMANSPIIAAVLKKENAVTSFRELIGATDPNEAESDTIRAQFATDIQQNAVHGADSPKNAQREANFFFSQLEYYDS